MQIHHILPVSAGGEGSFDNGIPVCLDCHAEIESRSNMGRRFSPAELRRHRDEWFRTVDDRPEVLLRAAHVQTETGPLEALLAELDYNGVAVSGTPDEGFPPLATSQFERAIATNALAALPPGVRSNVQRTYVLIHRVNYHFTEMAGMERTGGSGGAFAATQNVRNELRATLTTAIPEAFAALATALGQLAGSGETESAERTLSHPRE
jgi:hypothetical protein